MKTKDLCSHHARCKYLRRLKLCDIFNVGVLATALFILSDLVSMYTRWSMVLQENKYLLAIFSLVTAICLDLPVYLFGRKIREVVDGLIRVPEVFFSGFLAVTCFVVIYVPFFFFSMATEDALFQEPTALDSAVLTMSTLLSDAVESNHDAVSLAALFSSLIPAATTICSLLCGVLTSTPLEDLLEKNKTVKHAAQEELQLLQMYRAKHAENQQEWWIKYNKALCDNATETISAQEQLRIQRSKEALEERLSTVEGVLYVIERSHESDSEKIGPDASVRTQYDELANLVGKKTAETRHIPFRPELPTKEEDDEWRKRTSALLKTSPVPPVYRDCDFPNNANGDTVKLVLNKQQAVHTDSTPDPTQDRKIPTRVHDIPIPAPSDQKTSRDSDGSFCSYTDEEWEAILSDR